MEYAMTRTIAGSDMARLKERITEALQEEGFGVLTEIDLQATLKKKLNKDHLPHVILGACNPNFADQAISTEPTISTLLPCNVTIRQLPEGGHEIAAVDPVAMLGLTRDQSMASLASQVRSALERALGKVRA
jgi:uncharacterized protein (DUF302 family)